MVNDRIGGDASRTSDSLTVFTITMKTVRPVYANLGTLHNYIALLTEPAVWSFSG